MPPHLPPPWTKWRGQNFDLMTFFWSSGFLLGRSQKTSKFAQNLFLLSGQQLLPPPHSQKRSCCIALLFIQPWIDFGYNSFWQLYFVNIIILLFIFIRILRLCFIAIEW